MSHHDDDEWRLDREGDLDARHSRDASKKVLLGVDVKVDQRLTNAHQSDHELVVT